MKRFLKTFALLTVSLFLLVTGVNATLDGFSHSVTQNSFTFYNEQGRVILVYNGDLNACKACVKPGPVEVRGYVFMHRT